MTKVFEPDQTVYLPDGREAVYVIQNGDQHLVRVMQEVEGGYDEPPYSFPSDKITPVTQVYATAPVEVWDKQVQAKREEVRELDRALTAVRQEITQAARNKIEMEKAAKKYPCIQEALDFIEGRIRYLVQWSGYGAATIATLADALEDRDNNFGRVSVDGMKLLCLFGTDKRGNTKWKRNHYRDGSGGGWTQIWPAKSEDEARDLVRELLEQAVVAWQSGEKGWHNGVVNIQGTLDANPWLEVPEAWAAHMKTQQEARKAEKIARLREELAAQENEQ